MVNKVCLAGVAFLCALLVLQIDYSHSSEDLISSLGHEFDLAALKLLQSYDDEGKRQSSKDRISVMNEGGDTLVFQKIHPVQKLNTSYTRDIKHMKIKVNSTTDLHLLAVANHFNPNKRLNSTVDIYKFDENRKTFVLLQKIYQSGPYQLDYFNVSSNNGTVKNILVIASNSKGSTETNNNPHVSVYEIVLTGNTITFKRFQKFDLVSVDALTSFERKNTTYLVMGLSLKPAMITDYPGSVVILSYNKQKHFFQYHSTIQSNIVSDIEVMTIGKVTLMAIGYYKDKDNNLNLNATVYKFSDTKRQFEFYQTIPTKGVRDIESFSILNTYFLVVAAEFCNKETKECAQLPSSVYRLVGSKFQLSHDVEPKGPVKWTSIDLAECQNTRLLVYADRSDAVDQVGFYIYREGHRKFEKLQLSLYQSYPQDFRPKPNVLALFTIEKDLFLVIGTDNKNASHTLYRIEYKVTPNENAWEHVAAALSSDLSNLQQNLTVLEESIKQLEIEVSNVMKTHLIQNVTGTKIFAKNVSYDLVNIEELHLSNGSILFSRNDSLFKADDTKYTFENLTQIEIRNDEIETMTSERNISLSEAPKIYEETSLNVILNFSHVNLNSSSGSFGNIDVPDCQINNINVCNLKKDTITNRGTDTIAGTKRFAADTVMLNHLQLNETLNGVKVSRDLMDTKLDQTLHANTTFSKVAFLKSLNVSGKLNGIDVSEVLRLKKSEVVSGIKTFSSNLELGKANIRQKIDGVNFDKFALNTMMLHKEQNVTGRKVFRKAINAIGDIQVKNLTNNHDLDKWSAGLVEINAALSTFNRNISFLDEVSVEGNVTLDGAFNGLKYPDDVFLVSGKQFISGTKTFLANMSTTGNLIATGLVDNVNLSDTVSLRDDGRITGRMTFLKNLKVSSHIAVSENTLVDDVDLSQLQNNAVSIKEKHNITGNVTFTSNVQAFDCLTVRGQIDHVAVNFYSDLFARSVLKTGAQSIIGENTIMSNVVVKKNLSVNGQINGYDFPDSFLNNFGNQQIGVLFNLSDVLQKKDIQIGGLVSSFNMSELENVVTNIKDDKPVYGKKIFNEDLQVKKSLNFCCTVNNFKLSNLLTKHTNQVAYGPKSFNEVRVLKELETTDVLVESTIDGVDLLNFSEIAWVDQPNRRIDTWVHFENATVSNGLQTEEVNGIVLENLTGDIVTLSTNQSVPSEKKIKDIHVRSDVLANSEINNIDVSQLSENILRVNEDARLNGTVRFGSIEAARLEVNGFIHNSNISQIVESTVMTTGDTVLSGEKTISGDARLRRSMLASTVNEMIPTKDWVLKGRIQVISGKKTFSGTTKIEGDATVAEAVNSVDIATLEKEAVSKTKTGSIGGLKVLAKDTQSKNDVSIQANIDGIDLSKLDNSTAKLNSDAVLEGNRTFSDSVEFKANFTVRGLVNGKDITTIKNDAVLISGIQRVTGNVSFEQGLLLMKNLTVGGNISSSGIINGVQIADLEKMVVTNDNDQIISGNKNFTKTTVLKQSVDAVRLNTYERDEFVTISGNQSIEGKKTFAQTEAIGNVLVSKLADGKKLSQLAADTLLATESQNIIGQKFFTNAVLLKSNLLTEGHIDSKLIEPNTLLTLNSDQKINGTTRFLNSLNTQTDLGLQGRFSGINLTALEERRMRLNESQIVFASLLGSTFRVKEEINISNNINGIDFSDWKSSLDTFSGNSTAYQNHQEAIAKTRCPYLSHVEDITKSSPFYIDYFDHFQDFDNYIYHMEPFLVGNDNFIATVRSSDSSKKKFVTFQYLAEAIDSKFRYFRIRNEIYLLLESGPQGCNQGKSVLYKWNNTIRSFEERQTFPMSCVTSTSVFQDRRNTTWIAIATAVHKTFLSNVTLWKRESNGSIFLFARELPGMMPSSTEAFQIGNDTFLAIAMSFDSALSTTSTLSVIYKLNSNSKWELLQKIPTTRASDVTSFTDTEHHFVAFSNEQDKNTLSTLTQQVEVLRYLPSRGQFVLDHSFGSSFPMGIETLSLDNVNYLVVVMKKSGVNIYRFRLHFSYQLTTFIPQNTVTHVSSFMLDGKLMLAISSKIPLNSADNGKSKPRLLKAALSGIQPSSFPAC
eukprot:gene3245-1570_t